MSGEELKKMRVVSGLSQQAVGEAVGLTGPGARKRIYDYESGRRSITPIVGQALVFVLRST